MTIPVKKDTAPFPYGKLSDARLLYSREFQAYLNWRVCETCPDGQCDCPAPAEWLEAAAMEAYVAFTEALDMFVETLIAGRPYGTPLVEWEHRELDKTQDAAEMLAEMGQARREMGAEAYRRSQQAGQALGYTGCHDADCIPVDDVKEAAAER